MHRVHERNAAAPRDYMYGIAFAHAVTLVLTTAITVTLALKRARELRRGE